jgi:hypothetical protein
MSKPWAARFLLVAAIGVGMGLSLWGATQNALVTGAVFDQSGAAVAGATVRLINASIGFAQAQPTDANGTYTFSNVPPAENYVLSVEMTGFATVIRPGITVAVGDAKLLLPPFLLQPAGKPGEEIREAAPAAPGLAPDLVSTTLGGVVDGRTLRGLPLRNRDFLDLALLIPGTYPVEQGSSLEGASLVVNGIRADMNNFLLDGADNNDYTINQSLPFQFVEAMQEFRVQTSTSNAEFGRNAGAQVNELSRSGSNDFHGTAFWFNRNSALAATNAITTYRGGSFDSFVESARVDQITSGPATFFPTPILDDPVLNDLFQGGRDPGFNLNQFGANLGGPIARDKVFFFFNWESFRGDNDRPVFEEVPDLTTRRRVPVDTATQRVVSLLNLFPVPNVPFSSVTDVFGFPVSDPVLGSFPAGPGLPVTTGAFSTADSTNFTNSDNFLGRIDVRPNERMQMSFRYNIQLIDQVQAGAVPATASYPGSGIDVDGRNQNFSYNYVHNFSTRTINEFRFGWNRFRLTTLPQDHTLDPSSLFYNLNFTDEGFPTVLFGGLESTFSNPFGLGANFSAPSDRANNVWSWADNISLTRGRHLLKGGAELRYNQLNVTNEAMGRGIVTFFNIPFGAFTGLPDITSIARVSSDFGGGFDRSFSATSFSWFLQDTWRPRSNFSFTFGLRQEINQAPREARDRLVNHYPGTCPELICLIQSGTNTVLDPNGDVIGTAPFTAPRAGFTNDWNNFGPRVGLAWDPWNNGKTVFRAAYSILFDQQSLQPSVNMLLNPPFVQQWASFFGLVDFGDVFPPGFPTTSFVDVDLNGDGLSSIWTRLPYSVTARDPGTRTPYMQQFHLGVQQQLGRSSLFEISYVGALGRKLPRQRLLLECDADAFDRSFFVTELCIPQGILERFGFVVGENLTDSMVLQENSANSNFHSLQVRWETRNFHGLNLGLFYQWAHSIDDASSANAPVFVVSPPVADILAFWQGINPDQFIPLTNANPTLGLRPDFPVLTTRPYLPNASTNSANLAGERASSDFDIRQRFIINYLYDIPTWAPGIGRGWQVGGITTLQTGQPYTAFSDFFGVPLRPDQEGVVGIDNGNPDGALDGAVPGGCNVNFSCPGTTASSAFNILNNAFFRPGDLGRNNLSGPRLVNFDFSIVKNTYLGAGERVNLQFRVEFFNLFNQVNYRQPYTKVGFPITNPFSRTAFYLNHPFFGEILQTRNPREIQWGLKLVF